MRRLANRNRLSAFSLICLTRSRERCNIFPMLSRVIGSFPPSPKCSLNTRASRSSRVCKTMFSYCLTDDSTDICIKLNSASLCSGLSRDLASRDRLKVS